MEILQKLWLDTNGSLKQDYGISKLNGILNEVSERVDDILSLSYEEIITEIQKLRY